MRLLRCDLTRAKRIVYMMQKHAKDVTRTMLVVIFVALLGALSLWVMHPFLLAIVWAAMLVIATWPMML